MTVKNLFREGKWTVKSFADNLEVFFDSVVGVINIVVRIEPGEGNFFC